MSISKIHFLYENNGKKPESAELANKLIAHYGQTAAEDAEAFISIGGDGLLAGALGMADGKIAAGYTPPASNSRGFWTNHGVDTAIGFAESLASATAVKITPLRAHITFTNGNTRLIHAFNEVAIERATAQAVKMDLTTELENATHGPITIDGDGFMFVTPLGSTAANRSYGGPAIDIRNNGIILIGKGLITPHKGLNPVISTPDTTFKVVFKSLDKRPVRIDYDGWNIEKDDDGSIIESIEVTTAPEKATTLLLNNDPGLRAFSEFKM